MTFLDVVGTAVGGVGTIGGAALLVVALRAGQAGERERERRLFRWAVTAIVAGTAVFVAVLIGSAS